MKKWVKTLLFCVVLFIAITFFAIKDTVIVSEESFRLETLSSVISNNYSVNDSFTINYVLGDGATQDPSTRTYKFNDTITINDPSRNGYLFAGWYLDSNCTIFFDEYDNDLSTNPRDITLYAKWLTPDITYKTLSATKDINGVNCALVDWSNDSNNNFLVNPNPSRIRPENIDINNVNYLYLKGNPNVVYQNVSFHLVTYGNAGRSNNLTIVMENFNFCSSVDKAIGSWNCTNGFTLTIKVIGSNSATTNYSGGNGFYFIDDRGVPNLTITGDGNLSVVANNGANGASVSAAGANGNDGGAGGTAIKVNNLTIKNTGSFYAVGGNGGNGSNGVKGVDKAMGADKTNGEKGGKGGKGGNGGNAGYALSCKNVYSLNSKATFIGGTAGSGGKGGKGGKGGDGNQGWESTGFLGLGPTKFTGGNGGDGGDGGNGGDGGLCKGTISAQNYHGYVCENNLNVIYGRNGLAGTGGASGDVGKEGYAGSSKHDMSLTSDGKPGTKGTNGTYTTSVNDGLTKYTTYYNQSFNSNTSSLNNVSLYNNLFNGSVTHQLVANNDINCPINTVSLLKIKTTGEATPGYGGYFQFTETEANGIYYQAFVAKVPVGYTVNAAYNFDTSRDLTSKVKWLTSREGTGQWETYIVSYAIDNDITLTSMGFIYLLNEQNTSVPCEWYLAHSNIYKVSENFTHKVGSTTYYGHEYEFYVTNKEWEDNLEFCYENGGYLATINSIKELEVIKALMGKYYMRAAHLGGNDLKNEGVWEWVTGEPFNYSSWCEWQPDNHLGEEDYLQFNFQNDFYKWNDYNPTPDDKTTIRYFILEKGPASLKHFTYQNHEYILVGSKDSSLSAYEAERYANLMQGSLMSIDDDYEKNIFNTLSSGLDTNNVWVHSTNAGGKKNYFIVEIEKLSLYDVTTNSVQELYDKQGIRYTIDKTAKTAQVVGYKNIINDIFIPSTIYYEHEVYTVSKVTDKAFLNSPIRTVTIEHGIKEIGASAFENSSNLYFINMSALVETIGEYAFKDCNGLTQINIDPASKYFYVDKNNLIQYTNDNIDDNDILIRGLNLEVLEIPTSVSIINDYAFSNCNNITNVTLSESVKEIKNSAFLNCTNLRSINSEYGYNILPESVTSINTNAFKGCNSLNELFGYATGESISNNFLINSNLIYNRYYERSTEETKAGDNINWFITSSGVLYVYGTGQMYDYSLEKSVPWAKYRGANPTSITIKKVFVSSGITSVGSYAFNGCIFLTDITLGKDINKLNEYSLNSESIKKIFFLGDCLDTDTQIASTAFTRPTFAPNYDGYNDLLKIVYNEKGENWQDYNGLVYTNGSFKFVTLDIDAEKEKSEENKTKCFQVLSSSDSVYAPQSDTVTTANLLTIVDEQGITYEVNKQTKEAKVVGYNGNYTKVDYITIPDKIYYYDSNIGNVCALVKTISLIAIKGYNDYTKELIVGKNITNIDDNAFVNLKGLELISFFGDRPQMGNSIFASEITNDLIIVAANSSWNDENIQNVRVFKATKLNTDYENSSIKDDIYNINYTLYADYTSMVGNENVTNGPTSGFTNRDAVTIPDFIYAGRKVYKVTSFEKNAFANSEITSITFGAFIGESETDEAPGVWDTTFRNIINLEKFVVDSNNNNYFVYENCLYGRDLYSFDNIKPIRLVSVPRGYNGNSITVLDTCNMVCDFALENSNFLKVNLQNVVKIGSSAFKNNTSLSTMEMPNVKYISESAFENCNNLDILAWPESLVSIGAFAFKNCTKLKGDVVIADTVTEIGNEAFTRTNISSFTCLNNIKYYTEDGVLFERSAKGDILVKYPSSNSNTSYDMTGKNIYMISPYAFYKATNLTNVKLSDNTVIVGINAFEDCTNLRNIYLGSSYYGEAEDTLYTTDIFSNDALLENVTLSSNNENFILLNNCLFSANKDTLYCLAPKYDLKIVELPIETTRIFKKALANNKFVEQVIIQANNFSKIDELAFNNCTSLKEIYFNSSAPETGQNIFLGTSDITIYYQYEHTPTWRQYNEGQKLWNGYHSTLSVTITWVFDGIYSYEIYCYGNPTYKKETVKQSTAEYEYEFIGWKNSDGVLFEDIIPEITGDETFTAVFNSIKRKYEITWLVDGSPTKVLYEYGTYPEIIPSKEGNKKYTYEFNCWSPELESVTKDATYTALFDEIDVLYTVNFYGLNDEIIKTVQVKYEESVDEESRPVITRPSTDEFYYEFDHWTETLDCVTADIDSYPVFNEIIQTYSVFFYDGDNNLITTTDIQYGNEVIFPEDPVKASSNVTVYTFNGWDTEEVIVKGEMHIYPIFNESTRYYKVTFMNGSEVFNEQFIEYGMDAIDPGIPDKPSDKRYHYTFDSWDKNVENVVEDTTYNALFSTTNVIYTVNFYDLENNILKTVQTVYEGKILEEDRPVITRPSTDEYYFEFTGWAGMLDCVTSNIDTYPLFNTIKRKYTLYFYNGNENSIFNSFDVEYGVKIKFPDSSPSKDSLNDTVYIFEKWDTDEVIVKGEMHIYPIFSEATRYYKVTFMNGSEIFNEQLIEYGKDAINPGIPVKKANAEFTYEFKGWDASYKNIISDGTIINAEYNETRNKYTVKFYDEDEISLLYEIAVEYGSECQLPNSPIKSATETIEYEFSGWIGLENGQKITQNISVYASYTGKTRLYTVMLLDDDRVTMLKTYQVEYGENLYVDFIPQKQDSERYVYVFSDWSESLKNIKTNLTAYANYTEQIRKYEITWLVDGVPTVISYEYGQLPEYIPTKEDSGKYTYEFDYWAPNVEVVTGEKTYAAVFKEELRKFTVSFVNYDNSVLIEQEIEYGKTALAPVPPARDGYAFTGWDVDYSNVTGDIIVTAQYSEVGCNNIFSTVFSCLLVLGLLFIRKNKF